MRAKITRRKVDELQTGERDVFLWDTELPGFGCNTNRPKPLLVARQVTY
jgi:hypothetical protein